MELFSLSKKGKRFTAAATPTVCALAESSPTTALLVTNVSTSYLYLISGVPDAAPTVDTTCAVVPPGQSRAFTKIAGHTHLYALSSSGNADFLVNTSGGGNAY